MLCSVLSVLVAAQISCSANPKPSFLAEPGFQLTGYWLREGLMEGSSLLLSNPLDGKYPVRFSFAGCVASDVKQISAGFESGYLILSEPIREYANEPYDRLALFQEGQESYLVPMTNLSRFRDRKVTDWEGLAFRRLSVIP